MDRVKNSDLLNIVREAAERGRLRYTYHAIERMLERDIIRQEIEYVLKNGHHNKKKDQFNEDYNDWDYAIDGKTLDSRSLRIIIAIISPNLLIVTAINLSERG